jgi:DNA-binding transcriptional MerR regulator
MYSDEELPLPPDKRYFTIGEVSAWCGVKAHVLRYWEREFPALSQVSRRAKRRYYQRRELVLIRQIRQLLYVQGFTVQGARRYLAMLDAAPHSVPPPGAASSSPSAAAHRACSPAATRNDCLDLLKQLQRLLRP